MDSPWCSFIPEGLLSALANDNDLNADLRESAQETINTGNSLFASSRTPKFTDNGYDLLLEMRKHQPTDPFENYDEGLEPVGPDPDDDSNSALAISKADLIQLIYDANGREVVSDFVPEVVSDFVPEVVPEDVPYDFRTPREMGFVHCHGECRTSITSNVHTVYNFFYSHFHHLLFSKEDVMVAVTINYGSKYMNAHWTGKRVIFGSGDSAFLNGFDTALDIVAHEITHGVILRTSGLGNFGKPGALSEHLADVFGLLCKHSEVYPLQTAADCIWTIGEDLWGLPLDKRDINVHRPFSIGPGRNDPCGHDPSESEDMTPEQARAFKKLPRYIRSFKDPTSTMPAQAIHIDEYSDMKTDNGGVHHNSGIGNYAFYIAAMDAKGSPLYGVGKIWFRAMTDETLDKVYFLL